MKWKGIYFAKSKKTNFIRRRGRPNALGIEKLNQLLGLYYTKSYSVRKLAAIFGVSKTTILRSVNTTNARPGGYSYG